MARTSTKNSVYFNGCKTLEDLTARMMTLVTEHGDNDEIISAVSAEYDAAFAKLKRQVNKGKEKWQKVQDNPEELRNVALKLLTFKDAENDLDFKRDCVLELRGRWYYVYAKEGKDKEITKKYKDLLNSKGLGFKFSKRIGQWYWFSGIEKSKFHAHKGSMTVDESREKHGSRIIETEEAV